MDPPLTTVQPMRIGVIGVGRIGRMHAELLAHEVRGAAVSAVYDARSQSARDVASELGVHAAESVEEILDGDADAVAMVFAPRRA